MFRKWQLSLLTVSTVLLAAWARPLDQPWKDKQVAEWNDDDARQVLSDSPWTRTVKPTITRSANDGQRRSGSGISIGLPGMGRRGGMGYPGGGRRGGTNATGTDYNEPPTLKLRWESALPVREAEVKTHDTKSPTVDADHYAIAVYGVPDRMAVGNSQTLAKQLKKQALLKRDGKKDLKPSSVQVLQRDDGPVFVYLFPRSKEITRLDKRVEFDGQVGRLQFARTFYPDEMICQGKLEL